MMFTEEEKRIFQYEIGGTTRYADPLRIKRLLQIATGGKFDDLVEEQRNGSLVGKAEANGILTESTAAAFQFDLIDPATGDGFTEGEAIELLRTFLLWLDQKKTSGAISPTFQT